MFKTSAKAPSVQVDAGNAVTFWHRRDAVVSAIATAVVVAVVAVGVVAEAEAAMPWNRTAALNCSVRAKPSPV